MKYLAILLTIFAVNIQAQDKAKNFEELRQYHQELLEDRLKILDLKHKKKLEFETEMYELEKAHLIEIGKLESDIQKDNKAHNQKIVVEIKTKMKSFHDKMKLKSEAFYASLQKLKPEKKDTKKK